MRTTTLDGDLLAQLWRVAQETTRYNNATMNENVEHSAAAIAVLRVVASGTARTPNAGSLGSTTSRKFSSSACLQKL